MSRGIRRDVASGIAASRPKRLPGEASLSLPLRLTLAFVLCVFATVPIRQAVPAPAGIAARIAIAAIWIAGLAHMIRTRARS